jgi:hypothetical protein
MSAALLTELDEPLLTETGESILAYDEAELMMPEEGACWDVPAKRTIWDNDTKRRTTYQTRSRRTLWNLSP